MLRRIAADCLRPLRSSRRKPTTTEIALESLEPRQLLSAVNGLSDEFDDPATLTQWQRIHETEGWNADQLDQWDIGTTRDGQMSLVPNTVSWYQDYRGPLVFKEVTGDFVVTTRLEITDRDEIGGSDDDDVPSDGSFSLGGVMIRTPRDISSPADWVPGTMADDGTNTGENYVFLSMGHGAGTSSNGFTLEVKTTRNSDSQLELTPLEGAANSIIIQTARIGNSVITLYQRPGEQWHVHRRFTRDDMPQTLQVGLVSYSDYGKVSTYSPLYHNGHRLGPEFNPSPAVPFNPDVSVGFDYARFVTPEIPAELQGVDLVNDASAQQLLSFLGDMANQDPADGGEQVPEMGDQVMNRSDDLLSLSLPATLGGQDVSYSPEVIENLAAELQSTENLTVFRDDFGLNWGGMNEKWLQSDGGYVYLLPGGEVWQWNGSFASSTPLVRLNGDYYDDPLQLVQAVAIDVSVMIDATSDLQIDPDSDFAGQFSVRLTHNSPTDSGVQDFSVTVLNQAPQLSPLADVSMTVGQTGLPVDITATDADGDLLSFEVTVEGSLAAQLSQEHGLFDGGLDNYSLNWGGQQEKWLRGDAGWYYLLPDGSLYHWEGSFASSTLLGVPGADYYDDPQQLLNAVAPDASVTVIDGQLVIDAGTQTGEFTVTVMASDGFDVTSQSFLLSVGNTLPQLSLEDLEATVGQTLQLEFLFVDVDGHALDYAVSILGTVEQQLDESHGFWTNGEYFSNWGGQNEKWIRDLAGDWFYLLPVGSVHRWTGSFESSELIAQLNPATYTDPALLTDPVAADVTAEFAASTLNIHSGTVPARVVVQVSVTDGYATVAQAFEIDIQPAAGLEDVDSLFEDWGAMAF